MANFIQDDLAKVGIRMTPTPVDFNTLITNLQSDFQYDAILLGIQSGVPPDPTMMQNLWRSSGSLHFWFMKQVKPATPEEARIDTLMDEIIATHDLAQRKKAYKEIETLANEQALGHLAAKSHSKDSCQQSVWKSAAERAAPPDSLERRTDLREMTRQALCIFVLAVALLSAQGCRRRAAEVTEYQDRIPFRKNR